MKPCNTKTEFEFAFPKALPTVMYIMKRSEYEEVDYVGIYGAYSLDIYTDIDRVLSKICKICNADLDAIPIDYTDVTFKFRDWYVTVEMCANGMVRRVLHQPMNGKYIEEICKMLNDIMKKWRIKMTKNQIKKFVKEHKTEIIVGGVALVLGVAVGKRTAARKFKKKDLVAKFGPKPFRDDIYELVDKCKGGITCVVDEPNVSVKKLFTSFVDANEPCLNDECKGFLLFL